MRVRLCRTRSRETRYKLQGLGNCPTGAQAGIGALGTVPVDVQPAADRTPADPGNIATGITRTRA